MGNDRLRVLHLIDSLGLGGAQTVLKGYFEYQKDNDDLFLFSLRQRKTRIDIDHPNVYQYPSSKKYSFKPIRHLEELINKEAISILHCHLTRAHLTGALVKRLHKPDMKLIVHEHGEIFGTEKGLPDKIYRTNLRLSQSLVDRYIAVSQTAKQLLVSRGKIAEKRIETVYNYVDNSRLGTPPQTEDRQRMKLAQKIPADCFVIAFVGRLQAVKGPEYLIAALPELDFNYHVLIAGEGSQRQMLENLAQKLGVQDKVTFKGFVHNVEMVYGAADVVVMPSESEASPMAFYEAQGLGIPVIGSNVPALNEFIKPNKNGLLFDAQNPRDLAKKITYLFYNPRERALQGQNALEGIQQYSLEHFTRTLDDIHRSL